MIDIDGHFPLLCAGGERRLRVPQARFVARIDADIRLCVYRRRSADGVHPFQKEELFGNVPLVHHFAPDIQHKKSAMQRHRAPERISVGAHVREDHRAFQTPQDVCNF